LGIQNIGEVVPAHHHIEMLRAEDTLYDCQNGEVFLYRLRITALDILESRANDASARRRFDL
jgi:hypothetical protein